MQTPLFTALALLLAGAPDAADPPEDGPCPLCVSEKNPEEPTPAEPTPEIDPALYKEADWPSPNDGKGLYANDFQGRPLPVKLGSETWLSDEVDCSGRVLVINFWATWSVPCRQSRPRLDMLHRQHDDRLAVVTIAGVREKEAIVRAYLRENPDSMVNLYDAQQTLYREFESKGLPLALIVSTDGVIRWMGHPLDPNFKPALELVLAADPFFHGRD